ncbi:hypothetical protein TMatcc_007365 [Talaromyces marneffei ATCC 18224]|uniref:WW domain protein n=1 Tax=Talaromyces marneffei (strain ATCC 18224 / CBS 334.59 / QM 7333) TaxID=441960 RepID=B6QFQ0_TALMQ|nr:uncharacterized protein EYB26_004334 [Talaromyces marneffei]EEA24285.1 WW domain protein [Talaromyces marneffei ATCC 18224]KAE8553204.1 hypothetical protein EYB25_004586 [Talaromyces marneffei]QGA16667.1 hypothetical protein EYB26_004334 [Talaromyces marneffei]
MGFVENVMESFVSGGGRREEIVEERREYYPSGPGGPGGPPPNLPRPWIAQWDERERAYFYINQETGQRSWELPYGGGAPGGGYYSEGQRGYEQNYYAQEPPRKDHSLAYGAMGAAAGLVGGAILMHEGEELHDKWEGEENRIEERVEDFPENAANWVGNKVGEAEYEVDRVENNVENFPENAAEWVGDKVGGIERFGDEIGDAYDEGRAEGRDGW